MKQSLVITLLSGGAIAGAVGPIISAAPSVAPMTAQDGVQVTRTQGTYAARGGGSVSITTSEFRIDGLQSSTGATDTPGAGDVGDLFVYVEIATETGGTAPGTTTSIITIGTVLPAAVSSDALLLENGDNLLLENGDLLLLEA